MLTQPDALSQFHELPRTWLYRARLPNIYFTSSPDVTRFDSPFFLIRSHRGLFSARQLDYAQFNVILLASKDL